MDLSKFVKILSDAPHINYEVVGTCELCGRDLYEFEYDDGVKETRECICYEEREMIKDVKKSQAYMYRKASIYRDRDYQSKRLSNYKANTTSQQSAKVVAEDYASNFDEHYKEKHNLMFIGTFGVGKTHLSIGIVNELIKHYRKTLFITFRDYVEEVKRNYNSSESEHPILRLTSNADLMVIDDITFENLNAHDLNCLLSLVEKRKGLPTIYSTNAFKNNNDISIERIMSRIAENTKMVYVEGDDYRKRGGW